MIRMLYALPSGEVYDDPQLQMLGRTGNQLVAPKPEELIPLPPGASLIMLNGRRPLGLDGPEQQVQTPPAGNAGEEIVAVGAILPQGYTRTYLPATAPVAPAAKPLPLFGYTAVGFDGKQIVVAAQKTDRQLYKWDPRFYNTKGLRAKIKKRQREFPQNRIVAQLAKCATAYHCFTAQNLFYRRWEAGIPVSPACNARCLGCISKQPAECCPSPQARINYVPTVKEIVEIGVAHLQKARDGIISFGQGCEGEPSLQAVTLAAAIRGIRRRTARGVINLNTNAGDPAAMELLCRAGLNAIRVSLNSARPELYHAYYRPVNYSFADVCRSLKIARQYGLHISLNLLVFPGVTDTPAEVAALFDLLKTTPVDMLQLRNLNIDPDLYMQLVPPAAEAYGMVQFLRMLRRDFPALRVGNFSPYFTCQ